MVGVKLSCRGCGNHLGRYEVARRYGDSVTLRPLRLPKRMQVLDHDDPLPNGRVLFFKPEVGRYERYASMPPTLAEFPSLLPSGPLSDARLSSTVIAHDGTNRVANPKYRWGCDVCGAQPVYRLTTLAALLPRNDGAAAL